CVLDFSRLPAFLKEQGIHNEIGLRTWLARHPELHVELLRTIRFRDANQVAMQLFQCDDLEQVQQLFLRDLPIRINGLRFSLIRAVLQGRQQIESEIRVRLLDGTPRHLWLVLNLPESQDDYGAVSLSVN